MQQKHSDKWIHTTDLLKTIMMWAKLDCGGQQNARQVSCLLVNDCKHKTKMMWCGWSPVNSCELCMSWLLQKEGPPVCCWWGLTSRTSSVLHFCIFLQFWHNGSIILHHAIVFKRPPVGASLPPTGLFLPSDTNNTGDPCPEGFPIPRLAFFWSFASTKTIAGKSVESAITTASVLTEWKSNLWILEPKVAFTSSTTFILSTFQGKGNKTVIKTSAWTGWEYMPDSTWSFLNSELVSSWVQTYRFVFAETNTHRRRVNSKRGSASDRKHLW